MCNRFKHSDNPATRRRRLRAGRVLLGALWLVVPFSLGAADLRDAQRLYLRGDYTQCIRMAEKAISERDLDEEWRLLLTQALLAVGRYTNAESVMHVGLDAHPSSIRLRVQAYEVYRQNG